MSVEQLQQQLIDAYNGSADSGVQGAAQQAHQYTEMFKTGQMTRDEYLQLMSDLQSQANINKSMDNLHSMEMLNTAINGLINLALIVG